MNNIHINHIDSSIFELECIYNSHNLHIFMNSLIKTGLIVGGSSNETYTKIRFKANSVKPFKKYKEEIYHKTKNQGFSINTIANMIHTLTTQLLYLIEQEMTTIIGYHPSDIIVINDDTFVCINYESMLKINQYNHNHNKDNQYFSNNFSTITMPFHTNEIFVSPEQMNITELPATLHYKSCYFSFGLFIIYALLGNDEFYQEYLIHKNPQNIIELFHTHPIKNTKIYWILSRCLAEEPINRTILWV